MKIVGEVTYVIYESENSNFKVFEIKDENGSRIKVAGNISTIKAHLLAEIYGDFENGKYGKTFRAQTINIKKPTSNAEVLSFLSSGIIKNVGLKTAKKIIKHFGKDTLNVLSNPMELTQVKGISIEKAKVISESYLNVTNMQSLMLLLSQYQITKKTIQKIYDTYGQEATLIVKENPYRLIEDITGIGFKKADEIAQKMGIAWDSEFRVTSAIKFILKNASKEASHTYLPEKILYRDLLSLLRTEGKDIKQEVVEKSLQELLIAGEIFFFPKHHTRAYMSKSCYYTEKRIAKNLQLLLDTQVKRNIDLRYEIALYERIHKIEFHENQKQAIKTAIESGVCIISGGPGVGKTTIIQCIITILENLQMKIALCAPTGRAAKRMEEATGRTAKTIHRLLEYKGGGDTGGGFFQKTEDSPLEEDVVIVDEMSMTDEFIFDALLRAMRPGSKLILVGDKDQLQSVGSGNVLADLIASKKIDTVYLTYIYRQSKDNKIAENAQLINEGKLPNLNNEKGSKFNFIEIKEDEKVVEKVKELLFEVIPSTTGIPSKDIQVMSPIKATVKGVENLNLEIRKRYISEKTDEIFLKEIKVRGSLVQVGDKVMQMVNRYGATILNEEELNLQDDGVYNGDVGYVINIDSATKEMKVKFTDGKIVLYKEDDLNDLSLAYAITIHKSQGSEFPIVIIVLAEAFNLTKSMLYTAVTRAKRSVAIIGTRELVEKMVKSIRKEKRYTFLKEFLVGEVV